VTRSNENGRLPVTGKRVQGYPFQTHAEYTESGETAGGTQDREDGSRRLPARTASFSTLGPLFYRHVERMWWLRTRVEMRSASLVPRGEKRAREKKERSVFEGEREEKARKRSSSSIEKRVRLRRTNETTKIRPWRYRLPVSEYASHFAVTNTFFFLIAHSIIAV